MVTALLVRAQGARDDTVGGGTHEQPRDEELTLTHGPRNPSRAPRGHDEVRVAAYAVCRRPGELLLVRASSATEVPGHWFLPGGGIDFGEHPDDAVLRELTEETGLVGRSPRLLGILTDLRQRRVGGRLFSLRAIYALDEVHGEVRHEIGGTSDEARWVPIDELGELRLASYVLGALALSEEK